MRVLLAVHYIKIINNKNNQLPSKFGNNNDFLKLFNKFIKYLFKEERHWERLNKPKLTLDCTSYKAIKYSISDRYIYGFIEAGKNGEELKVKNFESNSKKIKRIKKEDSTMRRAFFYLYVPNHNNQAFLVLQVPEGYGVKTLLEYTLRVFFATEGLKEYHIQIENVINEKIFYTMIDEGLLKEMAFTKKGIPASKDDLNNKDFKPEIGSGKVRTIYQDNNLGERFKTFAQNIFKKKSYSNIGDERTVIEFDGIEADELSLKLEFKGKQKTFHIANYGRTLPDIDVTDEVQNKLGELDIDKLAAKSVELISEVDNKIKKDDITN